MAQLSDFKVKALIGQGGFGKVFLVQKKCKNDEDLEKNVYAMKTIRKEDIINYEMLESTLLEKRIL